MMGRTFTLTYPDGDYAKALRDYAHAQEWVVVSGLKAHPEIGGTIAHPDHPRCPAGTYAVHESLLPLPEWKVVLAIDADTAAAVEFLMSRELPAGAVLVETDERPWWQRERLRVIEYLAIIRSHLEGMRLETPDPTQ